MTYQSLPYIHHVSFHKFEDEQRELVDNSHNSFRSSIMRFVNKSIFNFR